MTTGKSGHKLTQADIRGRLNRVDGMTERSRVAPAELRAQVQQVMSSARSLSSMAQELLQVAAL